MADVTTKSIIMFQFSVGLLTQILNYTSDKIARQHIIVMRKILLLRYYLDKCILVLLIILEFLVCY